METTQAMSFVLTALFSLYYLHVNANDKCLGNVKLLAVVQCTTSNENMNSLISKGVDLRLISFLNIFNDTEYV